MKKHVMMIIQMYQSILRPLPVTSGQNGNYQKLRLEILGGGLGGISKIQVLLLPCNCILEAFGAPAPSSRVTVKSHKKS